MSGTGWGIGAVVLFALALWYEKRQKRGRSGIPGVAAPGFFVIRPVQPGSNIFKNIVVLAVVIGLGWFFWYVMGTRCHGAC